LHVGYHHIAGVKAVGRNSVEQIISEKLNGETLDDPNAGKNPAAVALAVC